MQRSCHVRNYGVFFVEGRRGGCLLPAACSQPPGSLGQGGGLCFCQLWGDEAKVCFSVPV